MIFYSLTLLSILPVTFMAENNVDVEPTSVPQIPSLLDTDTCNPPCWFGLTPGVSTAEEVFAALKKYEREDIWVVGELDGTFDSSNQYLIDGYYTFTWVDAADLDSTLPYSGTILIQENGLHQINYVPPKRMTLGGVIDTMGQPQLIRATHFYFIFLTLFYQSEGSIVTVTVDVDRERCQMETFLEEYEVIGVDYYPPKDNETFLVDDLVDQFLIIPNEDWETWMSGEVEGSCDDAYMSILRQPRFSATQTAVASPRLTTTPPAITPTPG